MEALIKRVKEATGPDRELDADIWLASGEHPLHFGRDHVREHPQAYDVPRYTASLDAALSLVPGGMEIELSTLYHIAHAEVGLNCSDEGGPWKARRKDMNLALALCAASLRARLSMKGE